MMLHTLTALERMSISAMDGDVGTVKDTYFDDHTWTLRYLVLDTGKWLPGRKVLVSPWAVKAIDWQERAVMVNLTREHIENCPPIDAAKPVTKQHETAYFDHYGYPYYWHGPFRWGPVAFPPKAGPSARRASNAWSEQELRARDRAADPHLRSTEAVTGYHIQAADGAIGHLQDLLFDNEDWSLRFLAVDTRNWLPGRHVLVAIEWVQDVSWDERKVHVSLTRDAVREAPGWHPQFALSPQDEHDLWRGLGARIFHRRASQSKQLR